MSFSRYDRPALQSAEGELCARQCMLFCVYTVVAMASIWTLCVIINCVVHDMVLLLLSRSVPCHLSRSSSASHALADQTTLKYKFIVGEVLSNVVIKALA